jgi:hypothetical protein
MNKVVVIIIAVVSMLVIAGVIVFIVVKTRRNTGGGGTGGGGTDEISVRINNNILQWSTDNTTWHDTNTLTSVMKVVLVKKGVNMWVAAAHNSLDNTVILNSTDGKMWNIVYNTEIQLGKLRLKYNNGWSLEGENKTTLNEYSLLKEDADANYTDAVNTYATDIGIAFSDITTLYRLYPAILITCIFYFIISILEKVLRLLHDNNDQFNTDEFRGLINSFKSMLENFETDNTIITTATQTVITTATQTVFTVLDIATNNTDVNDVNDVMRRITGIKENSRKRVNSVIQNNTWLGTLITVLDTAIEESSTDINSAIHGSVGIWNNIANNMIDVNGAYWGEFTSSLFFSAIENSDIIKTSIHDNIIEINNKYEDLLTNPKIYTLTSKDGIKWPMNK